MSASHRIAEALVPLALVAAPIWAASATDGATGEGAGAAVLQGEPVPVGRGHVTSFAQIAPDGAPQAIGLRFEAAALDELPAARNATSRCFDLNGNGAIDAGTECEGDTEARIMMPREVAERPDMLFQWAMVNWQPQGHDPAPWSVPHFDIHFYMIPQAELDQIGLGPCDFFIDCEAQKRALMPVPPEFVHPDHVSVDVAVGQMGNHLIDSKTPELSDQGVPFTHTWIFGAYDGRIVFQEVMVTHDHLMGRQTGCQQVKQPAAWQVAGWYPTSYCIGYDAESDVHQVAMQDFVLRPASKALSMLEPDQED